MGVRTAERMTGVSVVMAGLQRNNRHHYSAKEERTLEQREKLAGRNALLEGNAEIALFVQANTAIEAHSDIGTRRVRTSIRAKDLRPLICSGSGSAWLGFVRAGAIKSGHGNAEQAVIDSELRAMMNQVVEAHAANTRDTRHGEDFLAAGQQLPVLHDLRIAYFGEGRVRLRGVLVKLGEQLLAVFNFRRLISRAPHRRVIELFGAEGRWQPAHHGRNVGCEPAKRAGFFMGFPIPLFIGTPLEDFAGVL